MNTRLEFEKIIASDIELYGWHVIKVQEDELGPSFGHSIGFFYSFSHPEIIIIGLAPDATHAIINRIGDAIKDGTQFQSGQFYTNIIEGVDCYFTAVNPIYLKEYTGYAELFYKHDQTPFLQCIYPTLTGIYPWQDAWPEEFKTIQPLLGAAPELPSK